jgi:hypothetical protein
MGKIVTVLREGTWLSAGRIRRLGVVSTSGTVLFLLFLVLTAHGLNDFSARPLGTDFSSFYAAGRLAGQGQNPYDPASLHGMQQAIFGDGTPYYAFAYPPIFLLLAWPISALPYLLSLAVWQVVTFILYLGSMTLLKRRFAKALPDGLFYLCASGFTAVFVNVTHGQNGFLTAALFAAAIALLTERPWLAGLCFGLATYKPQFGLLVPFALAAGGHWRSFAGAAATVLTLAAASALAFGAQIWPEFFAGSNLARQVILEQDGVGYAKMVSVFAWLRLWHLPLSVAYAGQALVALLALIAVMRLWRPGCDLRLQGAVLCISTLLATPFALDYDLMLLAPAILLLAAYELANRRVPFGATLLFALWAMPLFARTISSLTSVSVVPLALAASLFLVNARSRVRYAEITPLS